MAQPPGKPELPRSWCKAPPGLHPGPDGATPGMSSLAAMAREVARRPAVVIAVAVAALGLAIWVRAGAGAPDAGAASTAFTSGSAGLDQAVVRVKSESVANWRALLRSSKTVFAGGLAVLLSLVVADVRRRGYLRAQFVAVTPLLARRYSLVVRGPPFFQLS